MDCIVIDDEPLARKGMQLLIDQVQELRLTGSFSNTHDADEFLKNNHVDIVFLDIQMPGLNGIEFLKSCNPKSKIIITSAFPEFAVDAFDLDVTDYLVKPIRFERFCKALNKTMSISKRKDEFQQTEEDFVFIRTERKYVRAHYGDIEYIEGLKDYVIVNCGKQKHIVAINLKSIYAELPKSIFLRINKSYIINVSKIQSVDKDFVSLATKSIPIGEHYRKLVSEFINLKKVIRRA
jgi:two-component system, LytTR family, response regulator